MLKLSCDYALGNNDPLLNPGMIFLKDGKPMIPETELLDSLDMLDREGYVKLLRTIGGGFSPYQITTYGMDAYAKVYVPNYPQLITEVVAAIVNKNAEDNQSIQAEVACPALLVDHILDVLESNGHLKQVKMIGGISKIYNVSPALRRSLTT